MVFKLTVIICLTQLFSIGELMDPNRKVNPTMKSQSLSSTQLPVNTVKDAIDSSFIQGNCPYNQSLHSRSDLKDLINFVYENQSIDENIRKKYQSNAIAHRDKYLKEVKQLEEWLHDQPQHFKHVLESLSRIREDIIEPDVKKVTKLMKENSGLLNVFEEKNKTLYYLKNKLRRYNIMCSFNCDNVNYEDTFLDHKLLKRSVQDDYICSSLKDLYTKINDRMAQFLEYFNNESMKRFSQEDAKYHKQIENVTKCLHDKVLQKMSGTIYDVVILQDKYHHFVEKLNYSTILDQINTLKNLSLQVDFHMLQLSELIENYGRYCQNCKNEHNFRLVREVATNTENEKNNPKSILDDLLDEKFNETAVRVQHDWDNIFKELLDLIDENKNKNLNLEDFDKIREEINRMTLQEKEALQNLITVVSENGVDDVAHLVELIVELIKVIKEIIKMFHKTTFNII